MLKRLSEQADPNDPQASVSFGGFKKAIHKPVLYKGRYQIRLHSLSDSITVLKKSERDVEVIGAPEVIGGNERPEGGWGLGVSL